VLQWFLIMRTTFVKLLFICVEMYIFMYFIVGITVYMSQVPGLVGKLSIMERGCNHFTLSWLPPASPNGVIIGYIVHFKPGRHCRIDYYSV